MHLNFHGLRSTVANGVLPDPLASLLLVALAIAMALGLHLVLMRLLRRIVSRTKTPIDDPFVDCAARPLRWLMAAIGLSFVRPALDLGAQFDQIWRQAAGMIVPALVGWLAIALVRSTEASISAQADMSAPTDLRARSLRTRTSILASIAVVVILFLTACLMLFSIPAVRTVGVTLMASAGLAALAVGAAAQPLLKNLIAGIQLAFTEPIRIDDEIALDNEWGRIEEIHVTYVIVLTWDERRLVVPIARFIEGSFQNWTRSGSALQGFVSFFLDPMADVARLRPKYREIVEAEPLWDGRVQSLMVTDTRADSMEVRGLLSARDAHAAFDLRCAVREKMMAFIRDEMPEALPGRWDKFPATK